MKKVKIVIGANFGDEGKGLMTDYFCSQFPSHEKVLNVRFNGGAQAGHTVVTPDGRRHVFGHFGAGSFLPNVATYFGPDYILNAILFRREYEELRSLGVYPMVYVHPKCIFTMPQDMMMNQFLEKRRGDGRHGSCGVGIYETLLRNENCHVCTVDDILSHSRANVIDIEYYNFERLEKAIGFGLTNGEKALMNNQNIRARFNQDVQFMMDHISIVDEQIFDRFDNVVFEGAQGLMLDQNNTEYFPHLTPSNTGCQNVLPYLESNMDIDVCYVTRPYLTRHGAGRLDNECTREELGVKPDLTNHSNEWQGDLRYGHMDYVALIDRIADDWKKTYPYTQMSIAITHADESDELTKEMFTYLNQRKIAVGYMSYGPKRSDVKVLTQNEDEVINNGNT